MKQIVILGLILLSVISATGQVQNVDSLANLLNTRNLSGEKQLDIYKKICESCLVNNFKKLSMNAEVGIQLAEKENSKAMAAEFYRYKANNYDFYGKTDTAVIYYKKALELAIEAKNRTCEAKIYMDLGFIYVSNRIYKDNSMSLEYFLKALQIVESTGNKENIVLCLTYMGSYHIIIRNAERANYYLQQAKAIAEEINYDYGKVRIYYGLGELAEDVDESIDYASKALKIARSIGDKRGEALNLQTLAYYYCLGKGENDKAEKYAMECLHVADEFGEPGLRTCAWTVLSYVYLYQKRYDECKAMVLKAWETDSFNVQISTLTNLAAAYLYSGELDEAHDFFVKYVYQMEENSGRQFQKNIADMETKYDTEKKEMRIASLEKERQLYVWLGVAGVLLAFALGVALWQTMRNARKERQLIAANAVQDGEMGERARLASDLHDRLSGSLSAVKIELNNAESIQSIGAKLDNCIDEIRRITHNLMPRSLQFGLKVALEDFTVQFPNVHFYFFGEEKRIRERLEFVIYCCANELVTNSLRYSGAENINVQLIQSEKHISLTVQDDGCGFDEKMTAKGIGLKNIRDRVASCDGKIDIASSPGKGTETIIELRIEKSDRIV